LKKILKNCIIVNIFKIRISIKLHRGSFIWIYLCEYIYECVSYSYKLSFKKANGRNFSDCFASILKESWLNFTNKWSRCNNSTLLHVTYTELCVPHSRIYIYIKTLNKFTRNFAYRLILLSFCYFLNFFKMFSLYQVFPCTNLSSLIEITCHNSTIY